MIRAAIADKALFRNVTAEPEQQHGAQMALIARFEFGVDTNLAF
jgi:hypothetical protein